MIKIPRALLQKYNQLLVNSDFALDQYVNCKKWLRYYLDFCKKYTHPYAKTKSLAFFLEKLKEKKQSALQQKQAEQAVKLYYSGMAALKDPLKPQVFYNQIKENLIFRLCFPGMRLTRYFFVCVILMI